jgi:phosphonate dehydrogenase
MSTMRPLVAAGSRLLPATRTALAGFAEVRANPDEQPWDAGELARQARDADGLIAFMPDRIDAALLAACPRLRVVAGALKGADNLDLAACAARGVRVSVVEDLLSLPTAELGVALALGLLRRLRAGDAAVRIGHDGWRPRLYGGTLVGARVGILGMGGVGRALAQLLAGFAVQAVYHDPRRLPAAAERALALAWCPAEELPAASGQVLFLTCPLTAASRAWLSAARLARLAPGAVVVNVGRGSVVDEAAVADALAAGTLEGYAADVFACEDRALPGRPAAVPQRLLIQERTLFTPHLGSAVAAARQAIELEAVAALRRALAAGAAAAG